MTIPAQSCKYPDGSDHPAAAVEEPAPPAAPEGPALIRTVDVGPFGIYFTNVNRAMGLRAHSHTGTVTVVYDTIGHHGYPSFADTNTALERRIHELTRVVFKDATNEDIADRLWSHLDGYVAPEWAQWGGEYALRAVHLDVIGVHDDIGHDNSTTRYSVARPQGVQA